MPSALPMYVRRQVIEERVKGSKLVEIAEQHRLSYSTVRNIYKRYKEEGAKGLVPRYAQCGPQGSSCNPWIRRAALWLRRLHRSWGAVFIALQLQDRYPEQRVPCERTLQRWFKAAGLHTVKSRFPAPLQPWARQVHDTWQVDAKEKLTLRSGQKVCYLSVVDEKSGSLLRAVVFPPFLYQ